MKRIKILSVALLSACTFAAFAAVPLQAGSDAPVEARRDRVEFRADMESDTTLASGRARYKFESRGMAVRVRLDVSIEDAEPDTTYDVLINGNAVASVTTNMFGAAEVTFRTPNNDPDDIPNTPTIKAGDEISVGPVTGFFK